MDPGRDRRWEGSETRLVEVIRDEIVSSTTGRITFARFMERALTEPELGHDPPLPWGSQRAGDFLTAPELHPFFGRCLGRLGDVDDVGRAVVYFMSDESQWVTGALLAIDGGFVA